MAQVVRRPGRDRPDVSAYLALFEHKIRDSNKLSPSEAQAVAAFLCSAVPEFAVFASKDAVLKARGPYFSNLLRLTKASLHGRSRFVTKGRSVR